MANLSASEIADRWMRGIREAAQSGRFRAGMMRLPRPDGGANRITWALRLLRMFAPVLPGTVNDLIPSVECDHTLSPMMHDALAESGLQAVASYFAPSATEVTR